MAHESLKALQYLINTVQYYDHAKSQAIKIALQISEDLSYDELLKRFQIAIQNAT